MRARWRLLGALFAALLLSGCASVAPPAPSAPGLPDGIRATIIQQRADVAVREVQVRIRNDRDEAITIGDVSLTDDRFDGTATRVVDRESSLAAGASVDVRVTLPRMNCEAEHEGTSTATLHLVLDGEEAVASAPIDDALDVLPGIHTRECLGEALADVAVIEPIEFVPSPSGVAARIRLQISPTGDGRAQIFSLQSTPLLTFDAENPTTAYPIDLEIVPDSEHAVLEIPLVPQRCDPHVVQEDKVGTVLTFDVEVGEVTGLITIPTPPEMKSEILTWVAQWCEFGG